MLSHVHIGITDFERAFAFYGAIMDALGYPLRFRESEKSWAGWQPADAARPLFLIGRPFNGGAATPGNGQMVALLAPNRLAVASCYAAAMAHGATCEGPPGLRAYGLTITTIITARTSAIRMATKSVCAAIHRMALSPTCRA